MGFPPVYYSAARSLRSSVVPTERLAPALRPSVSPTHDAARCPDERRSPKRRPIDPAHAPCPWARAPSTDGPASPVGLAELPTATAVAGLTKAISFPGPNAGRQEQAHAHMVKVCTHGGQTTVLVPDPSISAQQQLEFYLWDLCGYLILRESFAPAEQAIAAVEWAYETGLLDPSDGWDPSVRAARICSILHR